MKFPKFFQSFKFFATAPNPKIISLSENKYGPGLEGLWKQGRSSTGLFLQLDLGVFNWPKYDLKNKKTKCSWTRRGITNQSNSSSHQCFILKSLKRALIRCIVNGNFKIRAPAGWIGLRLGLHHGLRDVHHWSHQSSKSVHL